jgi:hypothetical protein
MHTVLLQMIAEGMEIAAIFVRHIKSQAFKALLHRKQLEVLWEFNWFPGCRIWKHLRRPRRSVNISRGISRVPKFKVQSLRHQTAGGSGGA